jgi:hypothetical protein
MYPLFHGGRPSQALCCNRILCLLSFHDFRCLWRQFWLWQDPIRNSNVLLLTPAATVLQHEQPCASSASSRSHNRDVYANLFDSTHATIALEENYQTKRTAIIRTAWSL